MRNHAGYQDWRLAFVAALLVLFFSFGGALLAQTSRPFEMSSTAIQAYPNEAPLYENGSSAFTLNTLSPDVDVVTLFPEYLGIPFAEFALSSTPPANEPWTIQVTSLANAAKLAGKPLMVEIVLTRDIPVANATNTNGMIELQSNWAPTCMDFTSSLYSTVGASYINYATWIAKTFSPKYLVLMVENNLYYVHCGGATASWQALVNIERSAYDAVKSQFPTMIVFPSFKLEDLYDQSLNGFDQPEYAALANLKRDRLGIATYPFGIQLSSGFANPYELPSDYLTRVRDLHPLEPPIVITETGWNSASIAVSYNSACYTNLIYSDPSFETAYSQFLIYSGYTGGFDLITWWSDRDLIDSSIMNSCYPQATPPAFPECNGEIWCNAINNARTSPSPGWSPAFAELAFKAFGAMGLRNYDGTQKPGEWTFWHQFLALPVNTSP